MDVENDKEIARSILALFERVRQLEAKLKPLIRPLAGSALEADDHRTPHYPVAAYAHGQLTVAIGCIAALEQMLVRATDGQVEMIASPFGSYALVRNAIDTAAAALWLLEPANGTLRVKRRLMLEVDEASKASSLRQTMGMPHVSYKEGRRERIQEVAGLAGLGTWNPLKQPLPTMTRILTQLERLHINRSALPWLASWQLSSGHAHGKMWAQILSNELQEVEDTRTEIGARFDMTIRYNVLLVLLFSAIELMEAAAEQYGRLADYPVRPAMSGLSAAVTSAAST